uniref:Fatty acyl-CoA reductase n=2 Tax=Oryza sativa TaxID=4530 RepID=Q7XRZ9_ORYSJ|nr:OSJNBb0002N06.7 [Oryza sativa Japonica Group]CAH66593.1 OSIGBa0092G14.4 [Oryza sativa]
MEPGSIAERFRDRSILITGSTGFLAKTLSILYSLVKKILRVQPEVRKLYQLVRAPDAAAAEERVLTEFIEKCSEPFRQPYDGALVPLVEKPSLLPGWEPL